MKAPRKEGVVVIGGGLAGLVSAILLSRKKIPVVVVERKTYPFHRVCGEYISNETRPFLLREGLLPDQFSPPEIRELQLTSINGHSVIVPLDLGGFGLSRFTFDNFLYHKAIEAGAGFLLNTEVTDVKPDSNGFTVQAGAESLSADAVLAAFGKRSRMDHVLNRRFIGQRSPYAGVKYHIEADFPTSRIALHNFSGGYCGVCSIENGLTNLCYLTKSENLKKHRSIQAMEEAVMFRNPHLRQIFKESRFVVERPEVINEISFAPKSPIENNILMAGDAAGMITPLCGNGMAMAIHSAVSASNWIGLFMSGTISRHEMEESYRREWTSLFARRLWIGRRVQSLFGSEGASNFAVSLGKYAPPLTRLLVKATHGGQF